MQLTCVIGRRFHKVLHSHVHCCLCSPKTHPSSRSCKQSTVLNSLDRVVPASPATMAPKGRSAVWSHLKVQQAVDELSAAANDLTQQQSGKIAELIDYLKTGIPTIPAFGNLLRSTPVLSVLLSVVTARMQRQDLRQQELPLFWEVCIGLTQCLGGWQGLSMMNPGFFGREPSLEQQLVTAGRASVPKPQAPYGVAWLWYCSPDMSVPADCPACQVLAASVCSRLHAQVADAAGACSAAQPAGWQQQA